MANSRVHAETDRRNASRSRRDDTRPPPCSRRRTWPPEDTPHARTLDPQDPARPDPGRRLRRFRRDRSEEHTSELQSLMRISYAVFCLKNKTKIKIKEHKLRSHLSI